MCVKTRPLVLWVILCLLGAAAGVAALPRHDPVPGGVALVPLGITAATPPTVHYNARPVMVVWHAEQWTAAVGIPLATEPGVQTLTLHQGGEPRQHRAFTVRPKQYEQEWITLQNPRLVNPTPADLERIAREHQDMTAALAQWTPITLADVSFSLPVEGRWSSPFGLRRYYNGEPRRPHSGLDIAAPEGTPVRAPAPGRVVATGHYFFNGKTLFLEHGQGLVTMYCHLHRIDVKPDQRVQRGEIIGAVGQTGRATGAHLHWSISLNRTMVDPILFLPEALVAQKLAQKQTGASDLKGGKGDSK